MLPPAALNPSKLSIPYRLIPTVFHFDWHSLGKYKNTFTVTKIAPALQTQRPCTIEPEVHGSQVVEAVMRIVCDEGYLHPLRLLIQPGVCGSHLLAAPLASQSMSFNFSPSDRRCLPPKKKSNGSQLKNRPPTYTHTYIYIYIHTYNYNIYIYIWHKDAKSVSFNSKL